MPQLQTQPPPGSNQAVLTTSPNLAPWAGPNIPNRGNLAVNRAHLLDMPPGWAPMFGFKERWRSDGEQSVVCRFGGPWDSRKMFVDWCLGFSDTLTQAPGQTGFTLTTAPPPAATADLYNYGLSRIIPAQCPEPGYQHLYASEVDLVEPTGVPLQMATAILGTDGKQLLDNNKQPLRMPWPSYCDSSNNYQPAVAVYDVTFTARPYEIRDNDELTSMTSSASFLELERYVEREMDMGLQTVALPTGSITWGKVAGYDAYDPTGVANVNGSTIPDNAAYLLLATNTLRYVWHEIPDLPLTTINSVAGSVNLYAFDGAKGGWPSYPRGTLLCQAPKFKRYRHTTGRVYWNIEYTFLYKPNTWQALPNAQDGKWYTAVRKDNKTPLFPEADFSQLFKPPAYQNYQ